ncbi:2'-5' RNA ligase family protein [Allokutzneria albata]|uniref:2'-5' RNA ligase superfamily protein n=1 Tax=Allokutzneria albata TaxID=211114 RepID=A0A1H0CL42_ALLAB|nr:2'-5' RNA ligase family protein [Allokutzneria albata]SDN58608.1 2'-5' RNA ligase superfamily protein [Allokutzneria albata]
MSEPEHQNATQLRNHWWWRPGWRVGRRFYTWHLTFEGQAELHRLVSEYQAALRGFPCLDLIPQQWLHLTMQGVGFTDEVSDADVQRIAEAAQKRLANMEPVTLTFHRPVVFEEAIVLPPTPAEAVHQIRATIREAIADVWGPDHVPESNRTFRAHVSAAYVNADGPATAITDALSKLDTEPASAEVSAASLITLGRDEHVYTWRAFATAPLTG